jgi:hypothetical protein
VASLSPLDPDASIGRVLLVVGDRRQRTAVEPFPDSLQLVPDGSSDSQSWTITKVGYSVDSPVQDPEGLDDEDTAPLTEGTSAVAHGWDLVAKIRNADLVHVCRPYTRAGEVALLAAKALGRRTVLSDLAHRTSVIGASFRITDLADCLICRSEAEADRYSSHPNVAIVDLSFLESWAALSNIYTELVGRGGRSA